MVIEVTSVSYANKGDCLMLVSAEAALRGYDSTVIFAQRLQVRTRRIAERLGVRNIAYLNLPSEGLSLRHTCNRLLRSAIVTYLLRATPLIPYGRVKAILDISGYSYGDSVGYRKARSDLIRFREAKRQGQAVILLPKTYGPFRNAEGACVVRQIIEIADLVLVRDRTSLAHVRELSPGAHNVFLYPDYTGGCAGLGSARHAHLRNRACIIPNYRAIDRVPAQSYSGYVKILLTIYRRLEQLDARPFVLLHETAEDRQVAHSMHAQEPRLSVIEEEDPKLLKGIIGQCSFVISSRLHGVINALNQAVPVIALGWSHKYEEVMSEFGVAQFCQMPPFEEEAIVRQVAEMATTPSMRAAFADTTRRRLRLAEERTASMWTLVNDTLQASTRERAAGVEGRGSEGLNRRGLLTRGRG